MMEAVDGCIIGVAFGLFYLMWMVDGRDEDRSDDVKFVGYCGMLESLKMVAVFVS